MQRPALYCLPLVVTLFACNRDKGVDTSAVTWELLIALDSDAAVAGQEVGYTLTAVSSAVRMSSANPPRSTNSSRRYEQRGGGASNS